jgi:hypothetical protein
VKVQVEEGVGVLEGLRVGVEEWVGVDVVVGVKVTVGVKVNVGSGLLVEVGVNDGPKTCPGPQAENNRFEKRNKILQMIRFILMDTSPIAGVPAGDPFQPPAPCSCEPGTCT